MTDKEPTDVEDFFAKIDWEGGIFDALEYGLTADEFYKDLPKEMRDDWSEISDVFGDLEELTDAFRRNWEPASVHGG